MVHKIPRPMTSTGRCGRWVDLVHEPFVRNEKERADCDWDWRWEIPMLTFGGGLLRRPRIFQLCLVEDDFPVGMVALLENQRWIHDQKLSAVYAWYLTGAPSRAVVDRGAPKLLTSAALDVAIVVSLNGAAQGRLWLDAAPTGGDALLQWYISRGLQRVVRDTVLPGPLLTDRVNDGRYFCLTPENAKTALIHMGEYRP